MSGEEMTYLKFSEFAKDDKRLEGPKKRIDEVLNKSNLY